ncbi:transglycosylase [Specibacter sp. RAF43]|uniref:aggregation-promoting factor C-terminal-like domain-containing protein n=1 Tax=Specibacter sp. RAF43 TaxID=3233057 RepID=UPI003F9D7269
MSSSARRSVRSLVAVIAAGVLLFSGLAAGPVAADDGPPRGFPSWQDVQNAKGNAAATQAEIAKINTLLDGLSAESEALGTAAVQAGAAYAATRRQLDIVSGQVGVLQAQSNRAGQDAAKYHKEVTAVAVQSYKSGGATLGLFDTLSALESTDTLQSLDLLHLVGQQAVNKQTRARDAQTVAATLTKARQAAEAERARLAAEAGTALAAAVAAQRAVTAQLAAKKQQSGTLTAQLAALNNTTAAVEQKYRQGQEAQAAYEAAQEAKRRAAEAAARQRAAQERAAGPNPAPAVDPDPNDGYIPVNVLLPNIPGGTVNDPAGAQAYAAGRLGAHGWSQGQFQCLLQLWTRESSWLTNATNPVSGAYGIAQALPPGKYADAGGDWLTNYRTQIDWGLGYIANRYGSPCGAWDHEQSMNWY